MAGGNGLMAGKRGLILGVANNRSIAWAIAKACAAQGAEIALTYQGDAFKKRVEPLAAEIGAHIAGHCDVTDMASLDAVFDGIASKWGKLDFLVHAIAFSDKDELDGRYIETSRDNFLRTMDISVYSFTTIAKRAEALMTDGGSLLTLTYYGAEKVMPHYNVMGVAKAAIEGQPARQFLQRIGGGPDLADQGEGGIVMRRFHARLCGRAAPASRRRPALAK